MTVGLVLVSHSARLAEGVRDLVAELAQGQVPIAVAAGGPEGVLGTSALDIAGAVESLAHADGVVATPPAPAAKVRAEHQRLVGDGIERTGSRQDLVDDHRPRSRSRASRRRSSSAT